MKRTRRYTVESNSLYPTYSTRGGIKRIVVLHSIKKYGVWMY